MTPADITGRRRIITGAVIAIGSATAAVVTAGPANADDHDPTPGSFTGLSVEPELDQSQQHLVMPTLRFDDTGATIKAGIDFSNGGEQGYNDALTLSAQQPCSALVIDHVLQAPSSSYHPAPSTVVGGYGIDVSSDYSTAISARSTGTPPTLAAVNNGTGPAATFTGGLNAPQIHLNPGHLKTHPAKGTVGDFYLDAQTRLWFCKGGASWKEIA